MARLPPPPPSSRITGPTNLVQAAFTEARADMEDFHGGLGTQLEDNSVRKELCLGFGLGRIGQELKVSTDDNGRLNTKDEGSWRRHMSLELEPLVPQAVGCCSGPSQMDRGMGKSMSVQNLMQAAPGTFGTDAHHGHRLPSHSSSTTSGSPIGFHSCSQDPRGGGGGGVSRSGGGVRGEEDLFISDKDTETREFDFLPQGTVEVQSYSSELLRTGGRTGTGSRCSNLSLASGHAPAPSAGSTELPNLPHVRLK